MRPICGFRWRCRRSRRSDALTRDAETSLGRLYAGQMGKVWVLDTETKGTGANVVPLEKVRQKPPARVAPLAVAPRERTRPAPAERAEPKPAPRFKVVDLMTRQTLIEGASGRETIDVLKRVRSVVDVNLYIWDYEREHWQLLTLAERRAIWNLRDR